MPAMFFKLQHQRTDWQYYAEPCDTGALAMRSGRVYWPRGKVLGGTSALNAMLYVRGNRRDYDAWAEEGLRGWGWDAVLEYFKKSEDNRMPEVAADQRHHGQRGPLKVDSFRSVSPMKRLLGSALAELGMEEISDCNGDKHLGYFDVQGTLDMGTRCSAAKAFLAPAKDRANLHVIKHAQATQLLWSDDTDEASVTGVQFSVEGRIMEATVRKEVIVSAGTINTPQLLMLSGIGPRDQLDTHNIPVRHDLPVGHNLQDHLIVVYGTTFHKSSAQPLSAADLAQASYEYARHRSGIFSHIGATDFVAFASTVGDPKYPDVQYHVFHCRKQQPELRQLVHTFGFNDDVVEAFGRANDEAEIVLWAVVLLKPQSKGRVWLDGVDPMKAPRIQHNYFVDAADLRVAVDGLTLVRNVTRTKVFGENEGEVVQIPLAECDALVADSDEYWQCYARHMTSTVYHPVGTARMGANGDERAVVDDQLRVRGVVNLRVVDGSVMPNIVSGNTNAPIIMIGEKAADMVKESWTNDANDENGRDEL